MRFDIDMASEQAELFLDVRSFIMGEIEENGLTVIERSEQKQINKGEIDL